ncbi:MAG: iron-sulfur cluster assembly scaffold protein, partial [Patescibacteria group bacterium]
AAEAYNATCGDKMRIEIKLKVKSIQDVRFSGEGCAISQASASMLTEKAKGMSATQIQKISLKDIQDMLSVTLTPSRVKCATLPLEVLQKAISSI